VAKRILLVDGDPQTLQFLQERLCAANTQIRVAGSAEDALERLGREKCDLVVSSLDIAGRLNGAAPAIFLFRQGSHRKRVEAMGPYKVLEAPVFMNDLYDLVESALGMKVEWEVYRRSPRFPIALEISVVFLGRTDTVIPIKAQTLDLSLDGLKFERTMCTVCTGYEKGSVHPDCVLHKYAAIKRGSRPVAVKMQLGDKETITLRAKVSYTLIEEGTTREFVGFRFVDMTTAQRERLRAAILAHR
jgi:CheY-like chemotaxis protein